METTVPPNRAPVSDRGRVRWWWQVLRAGRGATVDEATARELWRFYALYRPVALGGFLRALRQADRVWVCRDRDRRIRGFGALRCIDLEVEGTPHRALCLAQSALDPALRESGVLPMALLRCWVVNRLRHPRTRLYALLGASTLTGYLLVARTFPRYWPREGASLPPRVVRLFDRVAAELGYSSWDAETGVVRGSETTPYRLGVVASAPRALQDSTVAAYARLNPGQTRGDALLCIAPLTLGGWARILWRQVGPGAGTSP